MDCREFCSIIKEAGINYSTGVPCSIFASLINYILESGVIRYISATNEGEAIGIAAGAYLSGKIPMVLMQNSGLGNAINPLTSLNLIYDIPVLLLISGRGYKIRDAPEHTFMGKKMMDFLHIMDIPTYVLTGMEERDKEIIFSSVNTMLDINKPVAVIVKKGVLKPHQQLRKKIKNFKMSRYEAIKVIVDSLRDDDIVISTTGMISRELFMIKDRKLNFYMLGSMGCAAPIGLGISDNINNRRVVIIDGDGAILMKMGTLTTIGNISPRNLVHIVLDNEMYSTTGGQPTVSNTAKLEKVAEASNYKNCIKVLTSKELREVMNETLLSSGPFFVLVKVKDGYRDVKRVKYTPEYIRNRFMDSIKNL